MISSDKSEIPNVPFGPGVRSFGSREELTQDLAALIEGTIRAAAQSDRPTGLMLAGGSTPFPAYRMVADLGLRASALTLLFSDDRYVPSDDEASNYHQSRHLIEGLGLTAKQVLRVETERPLEEAAQTYNQALERLLEYGNIPLGLLGVGSDGHTASLFTDDDLKRARGRWALPVHRPDGRDAVSVTPDLLARLDRLVFVVTGSDKRESLHALLHATETIVAGKAVAGHRNVEVWADRDAWPG